MPPEEAARAEVRDLLRATGVAPMLAAPTVDSAAAAQAEADVAVARALAAYRQVGLPPCVWPLLADGEGYWPSAYTAAHTVERVHALLDAAERAGAPFQPGDWVALDLEPPLQAVTEVEGGPDRRGQLLRGCPPARFAEAGAAFAGLAAGLKARGLRTLAIAYPLVSAELPGSTAWQRRCVAPLHCGWDRVAVMTYSSMVAGYSKGLLPLRAARRYGYRAQAALCAAFPGRAGAFVGICGKGKLGHEPAHRDPEELQRDAAAARAAGAVEIAAFCLEGVLAQPEPARWLEALRAPARVPPFSIRGEAAHGGAVCLGAALSAWDRVKG